MLIPIKEYAYRKDLHPADMIRNKQLFNLVKKGTRWYIEEGFILTDVIKRKMKKKVARANFNSRTSYSVYKQKRGTAMGTLERVNYILNTKRFSPYILEMQGDEKFQTFVKVEYGGMIISFYPHNKQAYLSCGDGESEEFDYKELFKNENFLKCLEYKKYDSRYKVYYKDGEFEIVYKKDTKVIRQKSRYGGVYKRRVKI